MEAPRVQKRHEGMDQEVITSLSASLTASSPFHPRTRGLDDVQQSRRSKKPPFVLHANRAPSPHSPGPRPYPPLYWPLTPVSIHAQGPSGGYYDMTIHPRPRGQEDSTQAFYRQQGQPPPPTSWTEDRRPPKPGPARPTTPPCQDDPSFTQHPLHPTPSSHQGHVSRPRPQPQSPSPQSLRAQPKAHKRPQRPPAQEETQGHKHLIP
ncbi:hypothetical protein GMRT_24412 [Giardia muris]|uniref:Uncharacterized protein n=1 Tax=Giardia muris TaxID=5742 RepID=A0A4Z1T4C1_GIAMU|nr:hypothetical protein GMRT_24412 [Giardia muris]|eukprot:TNJ27379.1 hypothetical protein GMRT_24412 [Giardia muris]